MCGLRARSGRGGRADRRRRPVRDPFSRERARRTAAEVYDAADVLVQRGLRAQVSDTQLLGGEAIVSLDIQPDAPPATLDRRGKVPELPAGPRYGAIRPRTSFSVLLSTTLRTGLAATG